ncbi:unnamed protein product, partial [Musa hybrid cultivar]
VSYKLSAVITTPRTPHDKKARKGSHPKAAATTTTTTARAALMADPSDEAPPAAKKPFSLPRSFTYHHHPGRPSIAKPPSSRFAADGPDKRPKVVLYSTSLRGVRRTFDDCRSVRAILRGLRVAVDERDVSLDAAFRRDLQAALKGRPFALPQVFVGARWIGGAEEIRQMHEAGELAKILEGVARQDPAFVCHGCGGVRFAPCPTCNGSRKVFIEEERRLRRCLECNENGLVRCPDCCY